MKKSIIFWIVFLVGVILGIIIFRLIDIYEENKNNNNNNISLGNYIAINNKKLVNSSSNIKEPTKPNNDLDNYLDKYF